MGLSLSALLVMLLRQALFAFPNYTIYLLLTCFLIYIQKKKLLKKEVVRQQNISKSIQSAEKTL